jgi:hypothetical protein
MHSHSHKIVDCIFDASNFPIPLDEEGKGTLFGAPMIRGEDGVIEMVGKDTIFCPMEIPGVLKVMTAPEATTFLGIAMQRIGSKNDKGLQGYGCFVSDDGFAMHEGFFLDNVREGR